MRGATRLGAAIAALLLRVGLAAAEPVAVADAIEGDTLRLTDGSELRLCGVLAPRAPLGRDGQRWPFQDESRAALAAAAAGKTLEFESCTGALDRYGRRHGAIRGEDGADLAGVLLRRGLARVATGIDDRRVAPALLKIEDEARSARRGLWSNPYYRVLAPEDALRASGSFALVEGTVVSATRTKTRLFVGFGPDWHTDFSIGIEPTAQRLFAAARLDPMNWAGRRVRVRGWVRYWNGPYIEATHPEQVELLEAAPAAFRPTPEAAAAADTVAQNPR